MRTHVEGTSPRVSDSVGLGWGLGIHIANKFPGDADAAGLGATLRTAALVDGKWVEVRHPGCRLGLTV